MTIVLYNLDNGTNFDTVTVAHHRQSPRETLARLEVAQQEDRLFRTVVVNPGHYLVKIEPTTPELVIRELADVEQSEEEEYRELIAEVY